VCEVADNETFALFRVITGHLGALVSQVTVWNIHFSGNLHSFLKRGHSLKIPSQSGTKAFLLFFFTIIYILPFWDEKTKGLKLRKVDQEAGDSSHLRSFQRCSQA